MMKFPTPEERIEVEQAIEQLMKQPQRPDISVIGPLARKMKIDSAGALWAFFDSIVKRWTEERAFDSDWDS